MLSTIEKLEQHVPDDPQTMEDVRQQVYLRLLYMMSSQRDASLEPIMGVAPAQQDYWSKQLFALTTYLDHEQQPNDMKRATAARLYLGEAMRELSALSSITVRNLAFCTSVSSFGVYEPDDRAWFAPGDQISLYAEVQNFRSKQTPQGHHTSLATSYTIRKLSGETSTDVDRGQFPDVLDDCKNRRRDFHIQYGIELPRDLEPGDYELQLQIKDNLSQKIGHAAEQFRVKRDR